MRVCVRGCIRFHWADSPMSISDVFGFGFSWNRKCGQAIPMDDDNSIELVMLSTFAFTVIAIIIHFDSPANTCDIICKTHEEKASDHEHAGFVSLAQPDLNDT